MSVGDGVCAETGDVSDSCGWCNKVVADDDKALFCEICETWYHTVCEKIDDSVYKIAKKDSQKSAVLHYFCTKTCNKAASKILKGVIRLEKEVDELKTQMAGVDSRVASIEDGTFAAGMEYRVKCLIDEQVTDNFMELNNKVKQVEEKVETFKRSDEQLDGTKALENNETMASQMASAGIREMANRAARKSNLVLFNVPLSRSEDGETRKSDDKSYVETLCQKCLEVEVKCRQAVRLGKKGDEMRPLRVSLENEADVITVLKAKRKLKESEYRDIGIKRDMTPLEREEIRKLVRLKENKQKQSEENQDGARWEIRRDRVINVARLRSHQETEPASTWN